MFKSNCEGSHFPPWLSFFNTRDLQSWPTRQTVVQRAASAKRAPWPIAALAPNALPNGVLVHRSSRLAPPVCVFTLAPPVPSQVLSLLRCEDRLLPLLVYETHRYATGLSCPLSCARARPQREHGVLPPRR